MKKYNKIMLSLIIVSTFLMSCRKYEDGPDISLVPRKQRVANTWVIVKAVDDDRDVTNDYDHYELYLTKDGFAELDAKYNVFGESYSTETAGTWMFKNEQENILFDYEDDAQDGEYQILRLTMHEMWLRKTGDDLALYLQTK